MRTAAWEIVPQTALKSCSTEVGGRSIYTVLVKGEFSAIKHISLQKFAVSHEELRSP